MYSLLPTLPAAVQGGDNPAMLVVVIGFLILSLALHEYGHAWVANRCGDATAKHMGRLTLNPIAHIDLFWTILMPVMLYLTVGFAFGGAKPVPVNPMNLRHPLRDMMLVAIAGPLTNLVLAVVFLLAWKIAVFPLGYDPHAVLAQVLEISMKVNLVLAIFNMVPVPPLDGSRVMAYLLPQSLRMTYGRLEGFGILLVIGLVWLGGFGWVVNGLLPQVVRLLYTLTGGDWS